MDAKEVKKLSERVWTVYRQGAAACQNDDKPKGEGREREREREA
jgi:hypothetical protein